MESAIIVEHPNLSLKDVAGLDQAKRSLEEAVFMPLKYPQVFVGERSPWRGILLYGPPGTGKTFLAKAIAGESGDTTFITVSTADLLSKWQGESEKLIRALFQVARDHRPAIIFIDEIDSLLRERTDDDTESTRRIKTEFLVQLDGLGNDMDGVLFLAATNVPWGLDPAVRRRFEKKIYIALPDIAARQYLIKSKMSSTPHCLTDSDFYAIAQQTEGFSGADLKILTREASFVSVRKLQLAEYFCEYEGKWWPCNADYPGARKATLRDLDPKLVAPPPVMPEDFTQALMSVRPSVAQGDLARYDEWTRSFGQEGS
jgi:vacuolar protein-sorting-associated protein 4